MRLKSYFASSVDEAIERARQELGPEAMLLNSRKLAADQTELGSYEVVFGITGELLQQRKPAPVVAASRPSPFNAAARAIATAIPAPVALPPVPSIPSPANLVAPTEVSAVAEPASPNGNKQNRRQRKTAAKAKATKPAAAPPSPNAATAAADSPALADELAALRKQIQAVQHSLSHTGKDLREGAGAVLSHDQVYQQLVDFDFSDRLARRFLESASSLVQAGHPETPSSARVARALLEEINSRFDVAPRLGKTNSDRRVVMFVGPPGAGKTTTVAKLAVKLGIQRRLSVQLLSLDTMRVGGSEQLAEYARIIGVDFRALYTTAALDEVLDDCATKQLVLIDTPGYAPAEMDEAEEHAYFLRKHPEVEVQLVLPASLRISALEKFSERFAVFHPTKLLFTHLDEVDTFGPLLEHAMKTKLPVSFLTDGQSIPGDIEEASKSRLTAGLLGEFGAAAVSAA